MISKETAREKSMYGLRFDFGGNMLSLGKHRESKKYHVYPIIISYPRLPEKYNNKDELTFDDPVLVGEIFIHKVTGHMHHTPKEIIEARVGEIKENKKIDYFD